MNSNFTNYNVMLEYWAEQTPEKIAYTFLKNGEDQEEHLTYTELLTKAKAIAATLQMMTQQGDRVILLFPSGLEFIEAFFGCLYAGVIAVPVHHNIHKNTQRFLRIAEDAIPRVILTSKNKINETRNILGLSFSNIKCQAIEDIHANRARFWKPVEILTSTVAFLQYTSGSTSNPKGVMITHRNLMYQFAILQASSQSSSNDKLFTWLPLYHDMGLIGNILFSIFLGSHCIFMSPMSFLKKPVRWLQAISKYSICMSGAPNFAYDLVVKKAKKYNLDGLDLSTWKVAFCGAEPIRKQTLEGFAELLKPYHFQYNTLFPCFGLAEATLMVTASGIGKGYQTLEVNSQQLEQSKIVIETVISEETKTLVSAGQQILSQQIKIVQPKTQAALNELKVGEIWVSGEHVSKGYWNNPMMSQQKLKAQIQNEADEYLRTGDLGFMYQGELFVTGRIKDLIKVRGRSIYPQDIEFAIEDLQSKWTEIKDGGIGVFSHEENGLERLVAFVEIQPKRNPNHHPQQLTNEIVEIISNQFDIALADVVLIKSGTLPKTTSGKIQRYLCRQYYLSHFEGQRLPLFQMSKQDKSIESKTSTRFNASKIQFKIWLIDWVAQELEISSTEIQGNEALANYGLESLAAVSLADAIEEKLKINVSSTLAYDLKTIDAIVEHLAK